MKRDVRLVACIIAVLMLVLLCLFKCTAEKEDENGLGQNEVVTTEIPTRTVYISVDQDDKQPQIKLVSIVYYTITGAGGTRIDTAETFVEEHVIITPDLIVDYCLDSFLDEDLEINVLHITVKDGICTVDFDDSINKVAKESRVTEVCVLDALAMSLIDNCEEIEGVTYTINSQGYSTEKVKINLGSLYLSR